MSAQELDVQTPELEGDGTAVYEDMPIYDDDGGTSLGFDDDLSLSEPEEPELEIPDDGRISRKEQLRMLYLRRYLDKLDQRVQEKEYIVNKTREELKKCRGRVAELETERDMVYQEIQSASDDGNTSAVNRLHAQHSRVCQELRNEELLEERIKATLDQAEYDHAQASVQQGKYQLADEELLYQEELLQRERTTAAAVRNNKEQHYANMARNLKKTRQREMQMAAAAQEQRQEQKLAEMKKSKERTNKFLSQTLTKMKQREAEEQERHKAHLENRISSMLKLKGDIKANRENLRALQARDRAYSHKAQAQENAVVASITDAGGNATELLIKRKHKEEFEKEKELFRMKQRERQTEIAARILAEEEQMKKRKEQQPYLFTTAEKEKEKIVKPHPRRQLKIFQENEKTENEDMAPPRKPLDAPEYQAEDSEDEDEERFSPHSLLNRDNTRLPESDDEEKTSLAKPEFEGLWDRHKPYNVPKDSDTSVKLPGASKMDKEIMQRVLERHREGIVMKQVAGGKEFRGVAFYSKPDVIHFKDFDVGKTYKKKVTLTNVSYSVNYCKLTGLTEHLKDFIEIHFDPPGQMSAGLTCEMLVTFSPKINEDLAGEVLFLAQTGPFVIPIICTTKKCDLKVDKTTVEFGTSVIGETLTRTVTLTNNGAKGTHFDFYKVTGLKPRTLTTAETSLGRLTTADTMNAVSPDSSEAPAQKVKDRVQLERLLAQKDKIKGEPSQTEGGVATQTGETDSAPEGDTVGLDGATDKEPSNDMDQEEPEELPDMDMDELSSLDGMKVGKFNSGDIGPFSSVKLEIQWQPMIPGQVDTEFVFSFSDPESENISVSALAKAIDVPVWVERQTVDLKICMYNRLYQDTIIVNNRATTALRLKFDVCKELADHLELMPKTGYIQAQSQFSAQLKFLPRPGLAEAAGKYFDKETGVLEAPLVITVANQTRPVPFTVQAVVTNSDMEFDMTEINFGYCTIHESVKTTVKLTNKSILPQQFGFVGIPEYVDVQPDDGFGTLLPLETIELDIIFQPSKAREYNFELTCKSLINREFKISCTGVGVHPPLELSSQVVHFKSTAVNDVATTSIHVINSHTSMNEFSHPVPRIGKGEIAPVGPTSFEFVVPEGAPLTVSPSVGTVQPGKNCRIQVRFTPTLDPVDIRREAVRMVTKTLEAQAQQEYLLQMEREKEKQEEQMNEMDKKKPGAKGKAPPPGKNRPETQMSVVMKGPTPVQPPDEASISEDSPEYAAAQASLMRQFTGKFSSFVIPCYVASGSCSNPGALPYSIHNTLYMEVHCPAIKPDLVVISNHGCTTTDFGDVSIGQDVVKSITVQNISNKTLDLGSSVLDTAGPFQLLNALRMLPPDASHTLLVSFTPHKGQVFQEVLEVKCGLSTLHVTLKGRGVSPMVSLSVDKGQMDLGAVLAGEYKEETFKIMNTSKLSIQYSIKLDSQSLLRHSKSQGLPDFIRRDTKSKTLVGAQNNNGQAVFDCVPAEGVIAAGASKEITVTFAPDHSSDHYSDGVRIELFNQEEAHVFRLHGEAKPHIMYLMPGPDDQLTSDVESLAVLPVEEPDEDMKAPPIPLLVTLRSVSKENEYMTATKEIFVGCVRTMAISQKKEGGGGGGGKNGEWVFDNLGPIQAQGFNIDPPKGMIEAGTKRPITITWTPPQGHDPNKALEASINCNVKGDVLETYHILLRAFIVSE